MGRAAELLADVRRNPAAWSLDYEDGACAIRGRVRPDGCVPGIPVDRWGRERD